MIALAWRNIWRRPRRTLLSLSAIAFASLVMVFLLALQVGTYSGMEANSLGLLDGYAQVQVPGYLDDPGLRKSFPLTPELTLKLEAHRGVAAVAPRAESYALLSKGGRSLAGLVLGVDPARETAVSRLPGRIREGRYLGGPNPAEIVMGSGLARNLGVSLGDSVALIGTGRDGSVASDVLTVVGLFTSGVADLDRQVAEMPLGRFQTDFAMEGQIHRLVLSGPSLRGVEGAVPRLRRELMSRGLAVRSWGELEPGLRDAIRLDFSISLLWYLALVVVVVAILLNTILMSVLERTREFGILLAVGMRPSAIGRMVWLEILLMLAVGLAVGVGLGWALAGYFAIHGLALPGGEGLFAQWGLPDRIYPGLTPLSLLAAPGLIAAATSAAGLYPYLRLRRLEPVVAMRSA